MQAEGWREGNALLLQYYEDMQIFSATAAEEKAASLE